MTGSLFPEFDDTPKPPVPQHFDLTTALRALMTDITLVADELNHVDMSRVVVIFSQARHNGSHGVRAALYPLRFEGGERRARVRGHEFEMPKVKIGDHEALYAVSFMVPRFLNLPFDEKMMIVVHEMYHISPAFDGDVRRLPGGNPYHTGSMRKFNETMAAIATRYLAATDRPELHGFLRHNFSQLVQTHGKVVGMRMRAPNPRCIG